MHHFQPFEVFMFILDFCTIKNTNVIMEYYLFVKVAHPFKCKTVI